MALAFGSMKEKKEAQHPFTVQLLSRLPLLLLVNPACGGFPSGYPLQPGLGSQLYQHYWAMGNRQEAMGNGQ